ncbi:peptidylprolyl isomerase [Porphyromonas sp.]|uniref:peptidylprolyl isomerase n=1 Tax=Porphyromonas sp. TaxID=1924944 RepID=UPI0026DAC469|nr:peptidylprolyl isomerase [Porphyromonas sp.]MDO4695825.1 peptidylprolyl isomerase [Porphyromonas sp.]MDO4771818.1 peptidylprolyl isomerase [Porphyromonas sp.]
MKNTIHLLITALGVTLISVFSSFAQKVRFEIETNIGTMKGYLYDDVPKHVEAFIKHAEQGEYNGTLFTRVIPEFMIQGGAADSRKAKPGMRVGSGDRSKEIAHESSKTHFYKKGALAAPKQEPKYNPKRRSDMSQFFIVQGIPYTAGKLDTLELATNRPIKRKIFEKYHVLYKAEMDSLKSVNPRAYNVRAQEINSLVDSVFLTSPNKLIFTPEQREAYTQHGGLPTYEEDFTIYGEVVEGLELIDLIANQRRDKYDRPLKDMRIVKVKIIR